MLERFKTWLNGMYDELRSVNETPHRVALSFAMGVFLGILPFTGVLAAIALAMLLRLNKAAAILGSAITNTWLGFIVLGVALKIGAAITSVRFEDLQQQIDGLFKHFTWQQLTTTDILPLLLAVALGYICVSLIFALLGYILSLIVIKWHRR